jgi:hypothetical protein
MQGLLPMGDYASTGTLGELIGPGEEGTGPSVANRWSTRTGIAEDVDPRARLPRSLQRFRRDSHLSLFFVPSLRWYQGNRE